MNKKTDLLLIFTRNPEPGKCKTRLAATIGDKAALAIYNFLLNHTVYVTCQLPVTKMVCYTETIWKDDIWDPGIYKKALQTGKDLGERMHHAFQNGFKKGFEKVVIIGSDIFELEQQDLENAFKSLDQSDYVLGPAKDGGYYLLGMKKLKSELFRNKEWGTSTVFKDSMTDLEHETVHLLPLKNDIDVYEDIKGLPAFDPFITHLKND